jgi:RNA polymerase sigma-70 factor (ECF subfamily)
VNFSSQPYNSPSEKDSKSLWDELKNADPTAWKYVYDLYYRKLFHFAFSLIQNEMEAEDIVLKTFYKLWRLIDGFNSLNNLRAFLYVTVRNNCFDYLRHRQHVLTARKEILLNSETSESPYERFSYDAAPVRELISNCIDQLPEQAKRIFKMYYFDELNTTQIAFTLGMTEQAVRNNKTRAINLLKEMLFSKIEH